MGILCSCQQPVIYSKEKIVMEVDDKCHLPKKEYTNKSTTLKSKFFTKDTTLKNHSNDNSPDKDEIYNKILKNKLTELEIANNHSNSKEKNKKNENIKKIKTDIKPKVNFYSGSIIKIKKRENKAYTNNIHVIKKGTNLNRNSVPVNAATINKLILPMNINNENNKFYLGLRANSFNEEKRTAKIFFDLITTNTIKEQKKKLNKTAEKMKKKDSKFKMAYSIKTTLDHENHKKFDLHKNFIFMNSTKNFLEEIIDYTNILNYNDNEVIFCKGEIANNFYLIKQGVVLLLSEGKVYKKLQQGDTFGEIALYQNELIKKKLEAEDNISINNNEILTRNYTAISKGKTKLFSLSYSSYNNIINTFKQKKKEIIMSNIEENLNEKNKELIKSYKFFRYLKEQDINLITKMTKKYFFQKIGILLSITNYNNKKNNNIFFDKQPFFKSRQNLLLIIDGELNEFSENLIFRKKIKKNGASGIISILYPKIKNQLYSQSNKENTEVIYIPEEILIEVLGPNYSFEILKQYFFHRFLEQKLLSIFLNININGIDTNNLSENDKNKIYEIYNVFSVKEYNQNELIYSHQNHLEDKKIIMPIINNLLIYNTQTKRMDTFPNNILIEEIFYEYMSDFKIISENSFTIVLESKWKNIYELVSNSKIIFKNIKIRFDIYKDLESLRPFNSLTIQQIIDIGLNSVVKEFYEKEVIIKNKEKNNIFYLIIKGRVKVKNPLTNKTMRIYEEGNCFGCYNILTESPSNKNYISHQYAKCYCLSSEKFYEFLKINSFNDYIKNKLLLEDEEMQLNDFYYISYLGKGSFGYVCLVHNELSFYAIKAINRNTIEKGKNGVKNLINEKKCMIAIDHPFIVNYVKTLKNQNWVFILEEYVKGKNFEDYLMNRKNSECKNLYELIFYSGCMFHMLKYLTKRKICHRDIKPKNMMIDTDGYLKLLDFGCSKKIKFFSQTVVGTPNYMSPEVLKGMEYSFNCDYWSVGVCCYLIYFGVLPFGEEINDVMKLYKDILKAKVKIQKDCPLAVKELIDGLLKKNVAERINNFDKVFDCQIFQNFDWDNLLRKKFKPPFIPISDDFWGKSNLKNLASPFDKFIEKKTEETIGGYQNDNLNENYDMSDNYGNNNYNENNDEFNNNWYEYF